MNQLQLTAHEEDEVRHQRSHLKQRISGLQRRTQVRRVFTAEMSLEAKHKKRKKERKNPTRCLLRSVNAFGRLMSNVPVKMGKRR